MDFVSRYAPHALGLLRIVTALLFLQHGLAKLFGFPPGAQPGPQPLVSLLGVAGVIETVTGVLLVLGLFTRPAALVAAGVSAGVRRAEWSLGAPRPPRPRTTEACSSMPVQVQRVIRQYRQALLSGLMCPLLRSMPSNTIHSQRSLMSGSMSCTVPGPSRARTTTGFHLLPPPVAGTVAETSA